MYYVCKDHPSFYCKTSIVFILAFQDLLYISWGDVVHLMQYVPCCLLCPGQLLTIRSGRMCAVGNRWIFAGHLIQNNALKLLYVIGALLAVLVTGARCWTLCGCSMGGLGGSIWSAGCHTHTQVSLSGSGLSIQKLLYASSNKSVLISPNGIQLD